jgi:hypothetical protein
MTSCVRSVFCVLASLCAAVACGEPRRGGIGETCGAADDCKSGLSCVAGTCTGEANGGAIGLSAGASCTARRECASGLACISNQCSLPSSGTSEPGATRLGGVGESCQAKNDCGADLACVGNMCRAVELTLSRTPKSCYRVECATDQDCCQGFTPNTNCEMYRTNCEVDPIFCNTYRTLCECSRECVEELCMVATPGCKSSAECTSAQTPYCLEGKCRQCDTDSACGATGQKCVEGVCTAPCRIDENCPALHSCMDGTCVETGCKSDRECAFMQKNPRAVCRDAQCSVPCDRDADCTGDEAADNFQVCDQGHCVFVGCESNGECRALLDLEAMPGNVKAVCR